MCKQPLEGSESEQRRHILGWGGVEQDENGPGPEASFRNGAAHNSYNLPHKQSFSPEDRGTTSLKSQGRRDPVNQKSISQENILQEWRWYKDTQVFVSSRPVY